MKKMKFKNKTLRYWYVKFRIYLSKSDRVICSENEIRGKTLALRLICHPASELRICPETLNHYVINEELNINLIFNQDSIDFVDYNLHNIKLCRRNYEAILQVFNKHASEDRKLLDQKIREGVNHSFNDMYDSVMHYTASKK